MRLAATRGVARGPPRRRAARRAGRRADRPGGAASAAGAPARPADGRAVPVRPTGRRAGRLPAGPAHARRAAGPGPLAAATRAGAGDAAPGFLAGRSPPTPAPGPGGDRARTSRPRTSRRRTGRRRSSPAHASRLTSFVGRDRERAQLGELLRVASAGDADRAGRGGQDQPGGRGGESGALTRAPDGLWWVALAGVEDRRDRARGGRRGGRASRPGHAGATAAPAPAPARGAGRAGQLRAPGRGVRRLASRLLAACPGLRCWPPAASRSGSPGRRSSRSRRCRSRRPNAAPVELAAVDAVRLFVDRARDADPGFALERGDAHRRSRRSAAGSTGCRWRSSWPPPGSRLLPVDEIAARLDDRFRLLTGGPRTADARQQTLRATVDWSHELLTEAERVLFRRLSVFRGGWTLEAAEQVCADGGARRGRARRRARSSTCTPAWSTARWWCPARPGRPVRHAGDAARSTPTNASTAARAGAARGRARRVLHPARQRGRGPAARRRAGPGARAAALRSGTTCGPRWPGAAPTPTSDLGLRLAAALGWFWYFTSAQEGVAELETMLAAAPTAPARCGPGRCRRCRSPPAPGPASCTPTRGAPRPPGTSLELFTEPATPRGGLLDHAARRRRHRRHRPGGSLAMLDEAAASSTGSGTTGGGPWSCSCGWSCSSWPATRTPPPRYGAPGPGRCSGRWTTTGASPPSSTTTAWRCTAPDGCRPRSPCTRRRWPTAGGPHEHRALRPGRHGPHRPAARRSRPGRPTLRRSPRRRPPARRRRQRRRGARRRPPRPRTRDLAAAARHYAPVAAAARRSGHPGVGGRRAQRSRIRRRASAGPGRRRAYHRSAWQAAARAPAAGARAGATALEGLAGVAAARGDGARAAELLGTAARWRQWRHQPALRREQHDIDRAAAAPATCSANTAYRQAYTRGLHGGYAR